MKVATHSSIPGLVRVMESCPLRRPRSQPGTVAVGCGQMSKSWTLSVSSLLESQAEIRREREV